MRQPPSKPLPPALWPELTSGVEASCFAKVKSRASITNDMVLKAPNFQTAAEVVASTIATSGDGL